MSELTESTEYPPLDKNSELEHFSMDSFESGWGLLMSIHSGINFLSKCYYRKVKKNCKGKYSLIHLYFD